MTKKVYCEDCKYYEFGITAPTAYGAWCVRDPKHHKSIWWKGYSGHPNKNNNCKWFEKK